ncbi:helix-turn-helix transcriptional regulator [Lysobacter antibioticus]|uniref:helix-turn-helix transcriptional regulator n=1 Tax=Lysobacter antibioticus TaxID=84531 RepID=UPI0009E7C0DA|nr:helix-turn-helix transcriptional regulator [Lysobacter antibioticus]
MDKSQISEALRLLRSYHDLSQIDLAAQLNISRSYLSELESGKRQPSLELLKNYSQHFNVPLSAILLFSESVESGAVAEQARKVSTNAALKLLSWVDSHRRGKAA